MIYLLSTAVGLLVVVVALTAGLLYLATRDAAATEDGDGDDDEDQDVVAVIDIPADLFDLLRTEGLAEPYVDARRPPAFPILYLGHSGEHDDYPIGAELRQSYVDYLNASWTLPARDPGATL